MSQAVPLYSPPRQPIADWASFYLQGDYTMPIPPFHEEIYDLMESDHKRVGVVAPRTFSKSVTVVKARTLHQICEGSIGRKIILSETGALADHWMREIKRELEMNPFLLSKYGDMRTDKWTESHIICRREHGGGTIEIISKGVGYQMRGFHPDELVIDDIESTEGVRSEDQREKLLEYFNKDVINTLAKDQKLFVIGTLLHPQSLLANIMARPSFHTAKFVAIQPDGRSLWPERWPIEALREREAEIGKLAFASEFQGEPQISENPIFIRSYFQYLDKESAAYKNKVDEGLYTVIACDPAIGQRDTNDYTALVTGSCSYAKDPDFIIRPEGVVRGRWPISRQVTEMVKLYDKFKAQAIIIETVSFQAALLEEFDRYMEDNRRNFNIVTIVPDRDKVRRSHNILPVFEQQRVWIDFEEVMGSKLVDECIVFPEGSHDDMVDAMVYALTELRDWTTRTHKSQDGSSIQLPGNGKRSKHTRMV